MDGDGDLDLVCGNDGDNALYLNDGGVLASTDVPLASTNNTRSVALGDVDRDGDLDLVCGNDGRNTLYLNQGGIFASTPSWSAGTNATESVALGDVDSDGDLDLACGNSDGLNTVYLNIGGSFASTPSWSLGPFTSTWSVAWGDVDGDGDLDLVCGNTGKNSLYLNVGGVLATTHLPLPSTNNTKSVALGDVDGDGDFDLLCGNDGSGSGQRNTLYLNEGGAFGSTPSWESAQANVTQSVALGDVDNDGDLDLVCGNAFQPNTLYINGEGTLATSPNWPSNPMSNTKSIALGDVDGDGDLDLACANVLEPNTLYTNSFVALEPTPSWFSGTVKRTSSFALGDVDGDGDLDLVEGAGARPSDGVGMYVNHGGTLDTIPSWEPDSLVQGQVGLGDMDGDGDLDLVVRNVVGNSTFLNNGGALDRTPLSSGSVVQSTSFALGDVDGDGDLDLVSGNIGHNTLHLNDGTGVLDVIPSWESEPENATRSVALGDMDGDGDLDLVCGNALHQNTLYLNSGGTLERKPFWESFASNTTYSVALGDMDGDGDLDLVCGNDGRNTLYVNDGGGRLQSTTFWQSGPANKTGSLALGDMDGDGDLDLVCANGVSSIVGGQRQANTLYVNEDGDLMRNPSWSSLRMNATSAVALGDIDGDGDLDVVFGNTGETCCSTPGESNTLYSSIRWPAFKGDPTDPTNHLPNNAPHIRDVRRGPDPEGIQLHLDAVDVESDSIYISGRFQFTGDRQWFPIALDGFAALPLATSPTGTAHTATLDTRLLPFDSREVHLQLRITEIPKRVSLIQYASVYTVSVGRVIPKRPVIATTQDVNFPVVTVGDTVSATVIISNSGTDLLVLQSVDLPSVEMEHDLRLPVSVPAGEHISMEVLYRPVFDLEESGDIVLHSNDPLTPAKRIPTHRDARRLSFTHRLLPNQLPAALGENLIVLVVPGDSVRIEYGRLHLRFPGTAKFDSTMEMEKSGNDLSATIPGQLVTEVGFDYWVELHNDPVEETDPPDAPDSMFTVPVQSPSAVSTQAVSNSGFAVGTAVGIEVEMQRGTLIRRGRMHYRRGGEVNYETVGLRLTSPSRGNALIPPQAVTRRGVEYWVEVITQTDSLVDPAGGRAGPRTVRTLIHDLREEGAHPGGVYRMVSIPMRLPAEFTGSLETLLADQPSFGPYNDPTRWRSFRWEPASKSYVELESQSNDEVHRVRSGRAFWLISRSSHQVATTRVGQSTRTDEEFEIVLESGWNQIGNPFAFRVAWDDVSLGAAASVIEPPLAWNAPSGYEDATHLEPFAGYFLMNNSGNDVSIRIPPMEAPVAVPKPSRISSSDAWAGQIRVSVGGLTDMAFPRIASGASDGWDGTDRSDPPGPPGRHVSAYFPHVDWKTYSSAYSTDVRSPGSPESEPFGDGHAWRFDVSKNFSDLEGGDPVVLGFTGIDDIPEEFRVALLDRELGNDTDLRQTREYSYVLAKRPHVSETQARFAFVVGSDQFVHDQLAELAALPLRTYLFQNQPNPFARGTWIRYELASPTQVEILIYDARGRVVRAMRPQPRQPGRHELAWDGRDSHGRSVAAGLYFYRLRTSGYTETRKMLVVR